MIPLLLLHGWPSTFRDFYDMIPLLTTPRDGYDFVFEVIVPSIPGFVYSQVRLFMVKLQAHIACIFLVHGNTSPKLLLEIIEFTR